MCGLIGVINGGTAKWAARDSANFLTQGLVADTVRGFDSTGVMAVPIDNRAGEEAAYLKSALTGGEFVMTPSYDSLLSRMGDMRWIIGHNRWATVGELNSDNAHPFQAGPITLVHNGTLRGNGGLRDTQAALGLAVDSHAIACNLALYEAKEVIANLQGAYALIWHDSRDDTLNIVRNGARDLGYITAHGNVYIASEIKMGEWLASRNKFVNPVSSVFPIHEIHKYKAGSIIPTITEVHPVGKLPAHQPTAGGVDGNAKKVYHRKRSHAVKKSRGRPTGTAGLQDLQGGWLPAHPSSCVASLSSCGLSIHPNDRYGMTPLESRNGLVIGTVDELDLPVMLHGLQQQAVDAAWSRRWTVRPLLVSVTPDGAPVLIARAVDLSFCHDKEVHYVAPTAPAEQQLPGPDGELISPSEWYRLTRAGCATCHAPVGKAAAPHILWLKTQSIGPPSRHLLFCPDCIPDKKEKKE